MSIIRFRRTSSAWVMTVILAVFLVGPRSPVHSEAAPATPAA
jgi:hypothetical protein